MRYRQISHLICILNILFIVMRLEMLSIMVATLNKFEYTSKGGEREEEVVYPNKRYKSAHYDSPEETAYLQYPLGYFDTLIGEVSISKTQKVRINFSSWLPRYDWPSGWPEL